MAPGGGNDGTARARPTVVALVPARDRADSVGATVRALQGIDRLDRILVVDDGSTDATTVEARTAGAEVLLLPTNRGKGGAVAAAVDACPEADIFLLIDADLGSSAGAAERLLGPVLDDQADLVVGVLPAAGRKGGLGSVKRMAAGGIARACGLRTEAPLSGQRAVRAGYLRGLRSAERFGLEVAMTIDAVRAGARVREVDVPMDHRHTGRNLQGFLHRGRQGADIVRSLWSRVTSARTRIAGIVGSALLVLGVLMWSGTSQVSASVAGGGDAEQVVLVGVPHLGLDDLDEDTLPTMDYLADEGALAATSVRTLSALPSTAEAYATIGAGTQVAAGPEAGQAFPAGAPVEGGTAADVVTRRTGQAPPGNVLLPSMPSVTGGAGRHLGSGPGALGQQLADAGLTTAVVNNADTVQLDGQPAEHRPAAVAVADHQGSVGTGSVAPDPLLTSDPAEPYGVRADVDSYLMATVAALDRADMVTVDLGDTDRAASYAGLSSPAAADAARQRALGRVDQFLNRLLRQLDEDTLLLVVGVTPPTGEWELTPTIAYGSGVVSGALHSSVTESDGLITLTDLTPTVLDWFDLDSSSALAGMTGQSLRFRPEPPDLASLQQLDDPAESWERSHYPMAVTFIWVQALVYLLAVVLFSRRAAHRVGPLLRWVVLTFAAWPLGTFVERAVPNMERIASDRQWTIWVVAGGIAAAASRARQRPLAPLAWIAGATLAMLGADVVATGTELQMASVVAVFVGPCLTLLALHHERGLPVLLAPLRALGHDEQVVEAAFAVGGEEGLLDPGGHRGLGP